MSSQQTITLLSMCGAIVCIAIGCGHDGRGKSYEREVVDFEKQVQIKANPEFLRAWAIRVLDECQTWPKTNGLAGVGSFQVTNLPVELTKLCTTRYPDVYAFVYSTNSERFSHVAVRWGDGFSGHWGLNIGSTNLDEVPSRWSERWQPGVFFWREYPPSH